MTREELIFLLKMNTRYSRGYLESLSDEELQKLYEEKIING